MAVTIMSFFSCFMFCEMEVFSRCGLIVLDIDYRLCH